MRTTPSVRESCDTISEVGDVSLYRCPAGCFHLRLRDVTLRLDENDWRHLREVCRRAEAFHDTPQGALPS